jgi:hypothetical protein
MTSRALSRKERIALRRRKKRQQRMVAAGAVGGGLLLMAAAIWLWVRPAAGVRGSIDYSPGDVVYGQPLHAVHEMGVQSPPIPFLPAGGPQPRILLEENFYDFGVLGASDVVSKDFVIANVGEAPLTISRAYTTCGCTTADFTATVIPPGKVAIMTVTFDAGYHDVRGQTVRRGIIIENNDPKHSTVEVWIQATVQRSP